MKNILFILLFSFFYIGLTNANIIDNVVKEEKKFGDWTISCEEDIMMDEVECKIFSNFYNENSSIYIQPKNKIANQVVVIIPDAIRGTSVKVRVDKNKLITSDFIKSTDLYGVIPFSPVEQKTMLSQIKNGQNIYIRFTIDDVKNQGGKKEITAKISLAEFSKLLIYYDTRVSSN